MAKFCTNCGASLSDTAKFCNGCGTKQDDTPPVQQQAQQPVQQQPVQQQPVQQPPVQPQPQQQYQQQPYQQPAAAPIQKKKSKLPIILAVFGVFAVLVVVGVIALISSLSGILNKTAEADYYEMGEDRIPSVKYALGEERKVTGVNTSTNGKATTKEIIYSVPDPERRDEIYEYYVYLVERDGFYNLTQINFDNERNGDVVIGRNSDKDGYEIQIQLKYDTYGYTVTLLKQPGGITPNEPGDSGAAEENQAPAQALENQSPAPAEENQTPAPDPNTGGASGGDRLTKAIFDILYGDTVHVKMTKKPNGDEILDDIHIETYAKNGMQAVQMDLVFNMRLIVKDGIKYMLLDDFQMVFTEDADADEDETDFGIAPKNIDYIGEGSGEFYGKTYSYDEYRDSDGAQYFYYVDGGTLKGIRIISSDATNDFEIFALDRDVPDSVFEIPQDYEFVEEEEEE